MQYPTKRYQRQKGKKCPNFQDLFSLEDIFLAEKVRATYETGLSPIVLCAPAQRCNSSGDLYPDSSDARLNCLTLKLKYAIEVWTKAVLISDHQNPGDIFYYWWLGWKDNDTSFRHLEYHKFYRDITVEELLRRFWSLLESIADSGEIKVTEGFNIQAHNSNFTSDSLPKVECEIVIDSDSGHDVYEKVLGKWPEKKYIYDYHFDKTPKTYKWLDIKDMFLELNLDQLRLVQGEKMHKCSSLDQSLFDACNRMDIDGVRHAIEMGANVNALNDMGNSPITETIEYAADHFREVDKHYTVEEYREHRRMAFEKTKPIVELLIEHGADVDLFGFGGSQPLVAAYWGLSPDMTRLLLEHGSNPNYNSYLNDCMSEEHRSCVSSTVLYCIYDEIDDFEPEQLEIEKLMYQYGGRLFNWGFAEIDWEYIGKYPVWIEPTKYRGPFLDSCQETIGDCKTLTVEREDGETESIDLTGIKGLVEWYDQYIQNYNDMTYDWEAWRERGRLIAIEIAKLLPDYVTLYYLRQSEEVFSQPNDKSCMYYSGHDPIIIK